MPSIQKKIRDLERALKKRIGSAESGVAGAVKESEEVVGLKKRLQDLQDARGDNTQSERDKKLVTKYRMVKFVERKKITRSVLANVSPIITRIIL